MAQTPIWTESSRSGNTSGAPSSGTLASSATHGSKTCAHAKHLSDKPYFSSLHLLFAGSDPAMAQTPRWAESSRSGNTSGAQSSGTLASSATRGSKTCAHAKHLSDKPYFSSLHLLIAGLNPAMAQTPTWTRCSRSGNTSGAPNAGISSFRARA